MSFTEGVVQDGFTRWYKAQTGYQEKYFDDYSGLKTSVNSVGFIGSTPVIIEFKGYVRTDWVYYAEHPGGSLEDKIFRALKALCLQRSDDISNALAAWDGQIAPLVLIVVGGMSEEGQRKICDMMLDRAKRWGFHPQLWLWTGSEGKLICELEQTDTVALDCGQLALLDMPCIFRITGKARPGYRMHGMKPAFTCSGVIFHAECINRNHFLNRKHIVIPAIFGTAETEAFELPRVD